jgi:hypothetical protein
VWWQEESWPLLENGQARTVRQLPLNAHLRRWLLVTYRVDPAVIEASLPFPLRPRLIGGWGVAAVCFTTLGQTENAGHSFAVEWDYFDGTHAGMYVARRDTDSLLTSHAGGRFFPGVQNPSAFRVADRSELLRVHVLSHDKEVETSLTVEPGPGFQPSTLFASIDEAIQFFSGSRAEYALTRDPLRLDGVAVTTDLSVIEPVRLVAATSTFFGNDLLFPPCSAYVDSAFLMRDVSVDWRALPSLRVAQRALVSAAS